MKTYRICKTPTPSSSTPDNTEDWNGGKDWWPYRDLPSYSAGDIVGIWDRDLEWLDLQDDAPFSKGTVIRLGTDAQGRLFAVVQFDDAMAKLQVDNLWVYSPELSKKAGTR